ncbi:hypothetical protein B0H16DRAFT_1727104 [Mycena metata]|uniref:Uncharacterized protein n=1 Tax=Mycena metata TaxID=1033252 RepID=A0AAD7IM38_9AGAR|nr:hypothetical protein B0H16DRAFT_1727104 [Mycena metata]
MATATHCASHPLRECRPPGSPAAAPASSASTQPNDDDGTIPSSPLSPSPGPTSTNTNEGVSHAGSAFEGGARIAYDPRDLLLSSTESSEIGGAVPRLTLMEEVLLLGIKDKQGYLSFWNDNISYALGGKRLPLPDRPITVLSTRQTGETLLDETLRMMKQTEDAGEKMGVGTWVDLLSAHGVFATHTHGVPSPPVPVPVLFAPGLGIAPELASRSTTYASFSRKPSPRCRTHVPSPWRDGVHSPYISRAESFRNAGAQLWNRRTVVLSVKAAVTRRCEASLGCSGETWNVLKIGFQFKQVRERLANGLVDKGVLRTEKHNFLLFDIATHPVVRILYFLSPHSLGTIWGVRANLASYST